MQTGYQSSRYHDEERGEEYNACDAYNEYCNGHDEYNTCYYSDEGYGTYNSDGDYAHASIQLRVGVLLRIVDTPYVTAA